MINQLVSRTVRQRATNLGSQSNNAKGFTLVELIVTVAVVAVVLAVALPQFSTLISQTRMDTTVTRVVEAFQLARTAAIRQGRPAYIGALPLDGPHTPGNRWGDKGWLIWADHPDPKINKTPEGFDAGEEILFGDPMPEGFTLDSDATYTQFRFLPTGMIDQPKDLEDNGLAVLSLCTNKVGADNRAIMLGRTGHVHVLREPAIDTSITVLADLAKAFSCP